MYNDNNIILWTTTCTNDNCNVIRWDGGKCIATDGNLNKDTRFQVWDCNIFDSNMQFIKDGNLIKSTVDKNKCMSVDNGMNYNNNGRWIKLWDCNTNDPNQKFSYDNNKIKWVNNGTITNKCVAVQDGTNTNANGTKLLLWDCEDNRSFKFTL